MRGKRPDSPVLRRLPALLSIVLLAALPAPAGARDDLDPVPGAGALRALAPDGTPAGDCPLERTDVQVEIAGFVARVRVTQTFSNPYPDPIEAVYTFPLSQRGAVDALWMRSAGREIRGEIRRREEARRLYEQARARGQVASLLDQERPNVFTQHVANLMPGAAVEIEIHYVETLQFEAGRFEFSFPTVVGPRFHPPGRVPDALRLAPPVTPEGTRAGHDIAIEVTLDAGVPIRELESVLHAVEVDHRRGESTARVRLARRDEIPNRDFVLRYAVAAEEIRSGYLAHRLPGEDGYVTFVLLPPERVTPRSAAPKELVFVIDRSGSQRGLPLAKAKETLLWILDHMNPDDTFQVIDFGSGASQLFERPQLASPGARSRARRYIEALQANGGTLMAEAVRRAAAVPAEGHRLRVVTFMTDGYVGNDFEVLGLVRELRGTSRWFPFGTGNSVNRFLIENMAIEGGGEAETVLLNAPGEEVARRFWERIASPVLTDVRLDFRGLDVYDVFPGRVSDVWAERPLLIHARYRAGTRGQVVVTGYRGGEPYREVLDVTLPERARDHDALASVWARAKVDDLLRRDFAALQSGRFPQPLREEIVELALAHDLVTRFTSFVAVEERVVNRGGRLERVQVPVELPQGVTYEGVFGEAREDFAMAQGASSSLRAHAIGSKLQRAYPRSPVRRAAPSAGRPEPAEQEQAVDRVEPVPLSLSRRARERLAPELVALFERGPQAAPRVELAHGRARVKVVLARASDAVLQRLAAAGFDARQVTDAYAQGWVEVAQLAALAELEGVVRIEPGV